MSNVVELLTLFLEQVTPSKDLTSEQWSNLVSTVKNTLDNSKDYISNSADPLVEGFSTILNAIVANKYSSSGRNYYNALTLSRIGSFSSHCSLDSNLNTSSESESNQAQPFGTSQGLLDRLRDDRSSSQSSRSSSESSARRRGYSALVGTLKRLFLKERLERFEAGRREIDDNAPTSGKGLSKEGTSESSSRLLFGKKAVDKVKESEKLEELKKQQTKEKDTERDKSKGDKESKETLSNKDKYKDKQKGKELSLEKDKNKSSKENEEKEKDDDSSYSASSDSEVFVREPYVFRSSSRATVDSKPTTSPKLCDSTKKSNSSTSKETSNKDSTRDREENKDRDTNRPDSTRLTFRDEIAQTIPPLDLDSLWPHDHLTTPGDSESDKTTVRILTSERSKLDSSLSLLGHMDHKKDLDKGHGADKKSELEKDKNKSSKETLGNKENKDAANKDRPKESKETLSNKDKYKDKQKGKEDPNLSKKRERSKPNSDTEPESKRNRSKPVSPRSTSPKSRSSSSPVLKSADKKTKEKDKEDKNTNTGTTSTSNKDKTKDFSSSNVSKELKEKSREKDPKDKKDSTKSSIGRDNSKDNNKDDNKDKEDRPKENTNRDEKDKNKSSKETLGNKDKYKDKERDKVDEDSVTKRPREEHTEAMYKPLITLMDNASRVDLYVVAVEMIRASVRTIDVRRDVFNYRAIDPSVLNTSNNVDYSVQIMSSDPKMAHHINFGDVLRLKRVDANFVVDKSGRKHINIILSLKNKPSMRLWHSNSNTSTTNRELETERVNIDFNKPTDSARLNSTTANTNGNADNVNNTNPNTSTNRDSNSSSTNKTSTTTQNNKTSKENKDNENNVLTPGSSRVRSPMLRDYQLDPETLDKQIEALKREAIVVFYDSKVTMTPKDVAIINFLKDWSKNLKPLDILGSSEYTKPLTESSNIPQDFIVKVLKVCPDQSLMVADSEAKAIVSNFDTILATNLFETCNPIQKGDWLKLRCFIRVFNESDRLIKLSATKFSCVTRLPPLSHRVAGEEHLDPDNNGILVRERRVNLEELSRTSCLNDSFPRRFKRSRDFIHKLLSKQPPVQFQKASPVRQPVEKEEGEISQ